jgi:microcin C transport system permease protein
LVLEYKGKLVFPVFHPIAESMFGPNFLPTAADFSNPQVQAAINAHGWMLWPPIRERYDSIVWNAGPAPAPPSVQDFLGTDDVSRDVLARALYGLRTSLLFSLALTVLAAVIGVAAGAVQGFYGGALDLIGQRIVEIWSGLPQLFLLITLGGLLNPGFWLLLIFFALFAWTMLAALVRAEFLRARNLDYVRAARALGLPDWQIMLRHILPNALVAVLTFLPFLFADSIALLAGLDYLGFGLPGQPSLGELAAQAQNNPQAPWLACTALATLGGLLFMLVCIGEALRTAFDPRQSG